ncbi:MAG TPA: hypothetical protein VMT85_04265 [Thermoanaerobaculia bacterium]|nr:hypothetical protein [Thermoanaerobaculia bacterium]
MRQLEPVGDGAVVWDGRVFVTTAVPERAEQRPEPLLGDTGGIDMADIDQVHRWLVLAFDAATDEQV